MEQGADKDKCDSGGWTPLVYASAKGRLDIVQYLVKQGEDMDKTTKYESDRFTPLSGAAFYGHLDTVRYLLEQGADRDKADEDGFTPLHDAAREGHLEIAKLLMSYGADLNARTNDGELPIDIAATEEIRQAIRDEPRRRMDEAPGKRATEQDRHPNATTSASARQVEEGVEEQQSNKRPRLNNEGEVAFKETKIAEEDEDSEPSSDEADD